MKPEKLLERLAAGSLHNVAFADLCRLNLQDREGQAKPYQIRQLLALVEEYNLTLAPRERTE